MGQTWVNAILSFTAIAFSDPLKIELGTLISKITDINSSSKRKQAREEATLINEKKERPIWNQGQFLFILTVKIIPVSNMNNKIISVS